MTEVTGSRDFVAHGDQEQRPPDEQPDRLVMRAPDGRTVQVMTEDVAEFDAQGFVLETAAVESPTPKPKRAKAAPVEPEEGS